MIVFESIDVVGGYTSRYEAVYSPIEPINSAFGPMGESQAKALAKSMQDALTVLDS